MLAKTNICHHSLEQMVVGMANLSIRKIDEETLQGLRMQAASHGVSMEEEIRQILKRAVAAREKPGDLAVRLFNPAWGEEQLVLPSRDVQEPIDFGPDQDARP
jgi:plasmid stability protein